MDGLEAAQLRVHRSAKNPGYPVGSSRIAVNRGLPGEDSGVSVTTRDFVVSDVDERMMNSPLLRVEPSVSEQEHKEHQGQGVATMRVSREASVDGGTDVSVDIGTGESIRGPKRVVDQAPLVGPRGGHTGWRQPVWPPRGPTRGAWSTTRFGPRIDSPVPMSTLTSVPPSTDASLETRMVATPCP